MNLLLKMELIREGRGVRLPMLILFYNSILAFVTILFMFFNIESTHEGIYYGGVSYMYQFIVISSFQIISAILLVPFIVSNSFEEEKDKHIFDQLMLIHRVPRSYVLSKIIIVVAVNLLLYVSSLPIIALSCIYSGVSVLKLFRLGFMILLFSVWFGSISVLCYCLIRKNGIAFPMAVICTAISVIGNMILVELIRFGSILLSPSREVSPIATRISVFLMSFNPLFDYLGYLGNVTGDISVALTLCSRINVDAGSRVFAFLFYKCSAIIKVAIGALLLFLAIWHLNNFTNKENDLYN